MILYCPPSIVQSGPGSRWGDRGQYHSSPLHLSATTRANYQLGLFDSYDDNCIVIYNMYSTHHEGMFFLKIFPSWKYFSQTVKWAATGGRWQPPRVCYETQGTSDTHHWCLGMSGLTWPFISTQTSMSLSTVRVSSLDHWSLSNTKEVW